MTTLEVLIASPLEAEHVAAIESVDERVRVRYAPELLPIPRFPCDHRGTPRNLAPAEIGRWRELLATAEVTFGVDWLAPKDMIANCPRLRWIQGTSAGMGSNLAGTGLLDADIVITTAAGVHGVPLAEFALAGVLHFIKRVPRLEHDRAERVWVPSTAVQLAGQRMVLVGLGGIGRAVARVFSALGVEIIGVGRPGRTYDIPGVKRSVSLDELNEVLPEADILVLAVPLTGETTGLIGDKQLRLLPTGSLIVNIARGPVVDEEALIAALADGHLGGAVLDVTAVEPLPADSPLWELDNVLLSPHSAANVTAENALITGIFTDNLRRWLDGRPLRNVFDPTLGY